MMYTAMDLSQKSIQIAVRNNRGKFIKECKIDKNANLLLGVLKSLGRKNTVKIVMESGYNHQYPYKLLRDSGYDVVVAQPFMVKAIAYAKVKTDKVDARMLADLLAAGLIPEAYIPETDIQDLRDLVRSRLGLVRERVIHKNRIKADLAKRWITTSASPQTILGQKCLRELGIESINDSLDAVSFLNDKICQLDIRIREKAKADRYAKILVTMPGISYYSALSISSEIADIDRFEDHEHLCSYARLVPRMYQSGEKLKMRTASRRGSQILSWLIVQCMFIHIKNCTNSAITRHYNKIAERRNKSKAKIAAARKMMRIIYVMLKENKSFRHDG